MRLSKWFISNLDDSQRQIVVRDINENIIVQGVAGSGKTNLALHRAMQASAFGTYAIVIYTIALKRMVAYGLKSLGLDKERIAYDWQFEHRGFDIDGHVYCKIKKKLINNKEIRIIDNNVLFLVGENGISQYVSVDGYNENESLVSIDFEDWVSSEYFRAFGRRTKWFKEIELVAEFDLNDSDKYELISSAILFREAEDKIDYLIVDEAQDFNVRDYQGKFIPRTNKSITLLGDSSQKIFPKKGATIDALYNALRFKRYFLNYNYRLPKSIARVAQDILEPSIDLITSNKKDGGESDFPNYPKPRLIECLTEVDEFKFILNRIKNEDLDDVAILVPTENDVKKVHSFFKDNSISTQVHYRTSKSTPYRTINTLDFSNNDLPCILTYHSAKGTEFDNVFIPFATKRNLPDRNAFYVACTRSSNSLYILYTKDKTEFLNNVKSATIEILKKG